MIVLRHKITDHHYKGKSTERGVSQLVTAASQSSLSFQEL